MNMKEKFTQGDSPFLSFQEVRLYAHNFCKERNWEQFHLPTSLVLALAGECGEVCEIFQWKGQLEADYQALVKETLVGSCLSIEKILDQKDIVHIGEEIADVFIYTTRLCDVCGIDVAFTVQSLLSVNTTPTFQRKYSIEDKWNSIDFHGVENSEVCNYRNYLSHRNLALLLQEQVGIVTSIFAKYSEVLSASKLSGWQDSDVSNISLSLAKILLLLISMTNMTNLSIGQVIRDKFHKNELKYPAHLVKGSSAKYTAYKTGAKTTQNFYDSKHLHWVGSIIVVCMVSFILGSKIAK